MRRIIHDRISAQFVLREVGEYIEELEYWQRRAVDCLKALSVSCPIPCRASSVAKILIEEANL